MKEEEMLSVLKRYTEHDLFDDSDLYYNGLCGSTEFLDHKLDKSYKEAVACIIKSRWKKQHQEEKEELEKQAIKNIPFSDHILKTERTTKETPKTNIRLAFKLKGNSVVSVRRSDNTNIITQDFMPNKRPRDEDEDGGTKKRMKMMKSFSSLRCITSTRLVIC